MIMNAGGSWNRRKMMPVAARGVKFPKTITARYGVDLRQQIEKLLLPATNELLRAYSSNRSLSEVSGLADNIQMHVARLLENYANSAVPAWFSAINEYAKTKFQNSIKDAIGLDAISLLDGEIFGMLRERAISENVGLICNVPRAHFGEVMQSVMVDFRGIGFPDGSKSLAGRIQSIMGISKDRASFIARDQTAKLNGQMAQARQEDAGITHYVWRTAGDNRVVGAPGGLYPKGNLAHGNHYDRNGKVYEWAKPPVDGIPGFAPNCRCVASPILNPIHIRSQLIMA